MMTHLLGQQLMGAAYPGFMPFLGAGFGLLFTVFLVVLIIWSLAWKGFALWHAARNRQLAWFVIMLILNTAGILEIIYIIFFRKDGNSSVKEVIVKEVVGSSAE